MIPLVEAGSNTSTVAVEGDEKEPGALGCDWATLSLGDLNTGTWSSRLRVARKAEDLALSKKYFCEIQRK
jgi:hypothetical protein